MDDPRLGLGRRLAPDERDLSFPMQAVLPAKVPEERTNRYHYANGWWGDQGSHPHCVGYAWLHYVEDGPVTHKGTAPIYDPVSLYRQAQQIDEWPGEDYDGTSVRAGAKILQSVGYISEYRWAFDMPPVMDALLSAHPVVVGTNWYDTMFAPDARGFLNVTATSRVVGGHAYVLNGINVREEFVRVKNSWGRSWGTRGHAKLRFDVLERLIREAGEACLALERKP